MRAIWFMKITAVHMSSISKKRHTYSVPAEWTKAITEYLKDNLSKFAEQHVSNLQSFSLMVIGLTAFVTGPR